MRHTLAAALVAAVCVAELSVQDITASDAIDYLAILRENWEPEYQQYYKDVIAQSGITFAVFEAKIEEAKAAYIAAGYSPSQVESFVQQQKDQFLAETGLTYKEFKERFIQWYRARQSLYS